MKQNKIVITDIETGGFKTSDPIVEVGIVSLDLDNGNIEVIYDKLVKEPCFEPFHEKSWVFLHSDLKAEDVRKADNLDIKAIQKIANEYHMTAFNKAFDFRFLKHRGLIIKELDCPMLLATDVCKIKGKFGKFKWPKVEEAWKFFFPNIPYVEKHRGADDAIHEAKIVYELYKRGIFKVPEVTIRQAAFDDIPQKAKLYKILEDPQFSQFRTALSKRSKIACAMLVRAVNVFKKEDTLHITVSADFIVEKLTKDTRLLGLLIDTAREFYGLINNVSVSLDREGDELENSNAG